MLTQNLIKHISSLQQKKFRNEYNLFVAEGPKIVEELIDSKFTFHCIYSKKEWLENNVDRLKQKDIPYMEVSNKELERISGFTTPNLVLAVIKTPEEKISPDIISKEMILVLDEIKDPGNLGTIIRTSDWFGIKNIICSENSVDVYNPKVIQATMGSIARVNIYYTDLVTFFKNNINKAIVYGTFTDGKNINEVELKENSIIVIGNESKGISDDLHSFIEQKISISRHITQNGKGAESLNASVAAAIICYEFRKSHK